MELPEEREEQRAFLWRERAASVVDRTRWHSLIAA